MRRLLAKALSPRRCTSAVAKNPRARLRLSSLEERAVPALIPVTSNADIGANTLRAAIETAVMNGQDDIIEFQFGAATTINIASVLLITEDTGAAGKTITIRNGAGKGAVTVDGGNATELFNVNGFYTGPTFELNGFAITKAKSAGNGAAVLGNSSITTTTLSGMTITNCESTYEAGGGVYSLGNLTITNCNISGNKVTSTTASVYGGGIFAGADLNITGSTISGNTALGASNVTPTYGSYGGNIFVNGAMTLTNSTLSSGKAGSGTNFGFGAGVFSQGLLTITNSVLTGNQSAGQLKIGANTYSGSGGGIYHAGTDAITITKSTISSNTTIGNGGAMRYGGAGGITVQVSDTTFDLNSANSAGGTIWRSTVDALDTVVFDRCTFSNNSTGNSGGVFSTSGAGSGVVTFNNSTFFNNTAAGNGGVWRSFGSFAGTVNLNNCTLSGNAAASQGGGMNLGGATTAKMNIFSTIIAQNKAGGTFNSTTADVQALAGTTVTVNKSLLGVNAPFAYTGTGNSTGTATTPLQAKLMPLANYGGVTKTMIPMVGSPTFNAGQDSLGLMTDQRNDNTVFPRSFAGGVDIGATEANNPAPVVSDVSAPNITVAGASTYNFFITFTSTVSQIKASTLSTTGAVTVSGGSFGSPVNATLVGSYSDAPSIKAEFQIVAPPPGTWQISNNGVYNINIVAGITDLLSIPVSAQLAGTFKNAIPQLFIVDTTNDVVDAGDSKTSLREAIIAANGATGADSIQFSAAVFPGTITLDAVLGRMNITDSVFINKVGGPAVTIDAALQSQIFFFNGGSSEVRNLTFKNGQILTTAFGDNGGAVRIGTANVSFIGCTFDTNEAQLDGGAIGQNGVGNLVIDSSTFINNKTNGFTGGAVAHIGGGNLTITNSTFGGTGVTDPNTAFANGGAVAATGSSTVTISGSTFTSNSTTADGFVGGALILQDNKQVDITNSTFTSNSSAGVGVNGGSAGALFIAGIGPVVNITGSTFSKNSVAQGNGGAITVGNTSSAVITITASTFGGPMAGDGNTVNDPTGVGGAIFLGGDTITANGKNVLEVIRSTFSNNAAGDGGGAIFAQLDAQLTITNSTLAYNTAGNDGGALDLNQMTSPVLVRNSTIAYNTANASGTTGGGVFVEGTTTGAFTFSSTIVANNTANGVPGDFGSVNALNVGGNNNLVETNTGGSVTYTGTNPQNGQDPGLDTTLALNSAPAGTPFTLKLNTGSKAIDQGNNVSSLGTDQRGGTFIRTSNDPGTPNAVDGTDIGAFEVQFAGAPAKISSIAINGGGVQRSMVTSLVITFDSAVSFVGGVAAAFTLQRQSAPMPFVTMNGTLDGTSKIVTLTFTGGSVDLAGSLSDGRYTLTILANQFAGNGFDGDGNGVGGDNYVEVGSPTSTNKLFRFFGDADGNGNVGTTDFNLFRAAFGGASVPFDFDGVGGVTTLDFNQFRVRFGGSI